VVKIYFMQPSQEDINEMMDAGFSGNILDGRVKVVAQNENGNTAVSFLKTEQYSRLGEDYIRTHAKMKYISCFDRWYITLSENDYHNDLTRNPEKVIRVRFVEVEAGTGREVYRSVESGRYYLRSVSSREAFAKWLVCGARRVQDDGNEPRANLIFEHNGQKEKVTYDDWNGVCAYSATFNANFR